MFSKANRSDVQFLLRVARMYYEEDMTQDQIASEIGYSRPSISRLLNQARKAGIVRVIVSHPLERLIHLEDNLSKLLPLKLVRVTDPGTTNSIEAIGHAGAELLIETTRDGQVIAMGNGRSVSSTAQHVPPIPRNRSTIVQLLGSIPGGKPEFGIDSPTICHHVAQQLGATSARMSVPLFVDNPALRIPLMREERVATTMALAARAHVAVVGIAGVETKPNEGNVLSEYLTPDFLDAVDKGHAVGHILDHMYDASGNFVTTPLADRTIALSLDELRNIPLVIGVAAGSQKVNAIIAAIRGSIVNCLVTDVETAREIIARLRK